MPLSSNKFKFSTGITRTAKAKPRQCSILMEFIPPSILNSHGSLHGSSTSWHGEQSLRVVWVSVVQWNESARHNILWSPRCLSCGSQKHWLKRFFFSRAQLLEWCRDNSVVWENPVRVLQFIYSIMVSFSFLSYVALACYLVCILTIGYILWFFWVLWTLLLLNSNPRRSPSATTGRDDTCWLIYAYACLGQLSLPSDSLASDTYFLLLIDSFLFYGVLRLRVP